MRYSVGDLVYLKKVYIEFVGYTEGWYIIIQAEHGHGHYVCLEPDGSICFINEGMIDKRRKKK
jgi:hypothetical protein